MKIFYPVFALMGLTLILMFQLGLRRYRAVRAGTVDPKFFTLFRGYEEPEKLAAHSRHIVNLFGAHPGTGLRCRRHSWLNGQTRDVCRYRTKPGGIFRCFFDGLRCQLFAALAIFCRSVLLPRLPQCHYCRITPVSTTTQIAISVSILRTKTRNLVSTMFDVR